MRNFAKLRLFRRNFVFAKIVQTFLFFAKITRFFCFREHFRGENNIFGKTAKLVLPSAFVSVLQIYSRKLSGKEIFEEEINIFAKCFAKICLNIAPSNYFHKNVPLVSHVADKFCFFLKT